MWSSSWVAFSAVMSRTATIRAFWPVRGSRNIPAWNPTATLGLPAGARLSSRKSTCPSPNASSRPAFAAAVSLNRLVNRRACSRRRVAGELAGGLVHIGDAAVLGDGEQGDDRRLDDRPGVG